MKEIAESDITYKHDYFKDCLSDLDIPKEWQDTSWHNDSCPSYEVKGLHIFVDHASSKERERDDLTRFIIFEVSDEGMGDYVWKGDDWDVAKDIMARPH